MSANSTKLMFVVGIVNGGCQVFHVYNIVDLREQKQHWKSVLLFLRQRGTHPRCHHQEAEKRRFVDWDGCLKMMEEEQHWTQFTHPRRRGFYMTKMYGERCHPPRHITNKLGQLLEKGHGDKRALWKFCVLVRISYVFNIYIWGDWSGGDWRRR